MPPKVKICCISSLEEASIAIAHGADAIGLVGPMPSGPGIISNQTIHHISQNTPPPTATFLLTSEISAEGVVKHHQTAQTNTIQLVDEIKEGSIADIKSALPDVTIVQVVHITGYQSIDQALKLAESADMLLLDSGNPNLAIKELGGTGRTHNWDISHQICRQSSKPVFLAGGLNASNVKQAIDSVQPYGIDLCSGVRTNDKLDPVKLRAFFTAVNG